MKQEEEPRPEREKPGEGSHGPREDVSAEAREALPPKLGQLLADIEDGSLLDEWASLPPLERDRVRIVLRQTQRTLALLEDRVDDEALDSGLVFANLRESFPSQEETPASFERVLAESEKTRDRLLAAAQRIRRSKQFTPFPTPHRTPDEEWATWAWNQASTVFIAEDEPQAGDQGPVLEGDSQARGT
jgi:hypothetical protein